MTRRRFYASPTSFNKDTVTLVNDEARHLREVLRLKPGEEVYVFNGAGKEFLARIEESRRDAAVLNIIRGVEPARPESNLQLTLAIALLKGDKFDLVVQKATELGVVQIVPLVTTHADIRLRDDAGETKRITRWQRIAMEAAKQSGRALVPEVSTVSDCQSFLERTDAQGSYLMFSERDGKSFGEMKPSVQAPKRITALVGSEGGWSDKEIEAARAAGWLIITLGGRILRAETAAIAIAALLQHDFGDLV